MLFRGNLSHADLDTALGAWCARGEGWEEVSDVVPWVAVQTGAQTLLVEEVCNKTDTPSENEETVENAHAKVVLGLLSGESAAVPHQVNEADSNATVNVEDEVVLLGSGDGLDGKSVVEEGGVGEVGVGEFLNEGDTEIGVVAGLDPVADTRNYQVVSHATLRIEIIRGTY